MMYCSLGFTSSLWIRSFKLQIKEQITKQGCKNTQKIELLQEKAEFFHHSKKSFQSGKNTA